MQIDSARIRAERERRAWSQEQLAEVTGVSLRTVQRVETSGSASFETARALAAVFEVEVALLRLQPGVARLPRRIALRARYAGLATALVLVFGALFMRTAHAGEIALEVELELNNEKLGQHQLVATEGKSAQFVFDGQMRLYVNPIVTNDGSILLSMRVEEPAGSRWVEVGDPRILVVNGNRGEVKVTSDKGNVYRIAITPRRN
jgi:transcriptional regulator with XRE-family HTH domain